MWEVLVTLPPSQLSQPLWICFLCLVQACLSSELWRSHQWAPGRVQLFRCSGTLVTWAGGLMVNLLWRQIDPPPLNPLTSCNHFPWLGWVLGLLSTPPHSGSLGFPCLSLSWSSSFLTPELKYWDLLAFCPENCLIFSPNSQDVADFDLPLYFHLRRMNPGQRVEQDLISSLSTLLDNCFCKINVMKWMTFTKCPLLQWSHDV